MKKISFALFFCLCALAGFAQNSKPLDLKEIVSGEFIPQNISGVIPIPGDGEHYSQMNADKTQIIKYSFKTGKPVEVLFDAATARECPFKKFDSYSFAPDGSKLLIATETVPVYRHSYTAVHYIYSLKRNLDGKINNVVEKLSDGGPQQVPIFSPDGNQVAFVRDNNIFLVKLLYGNSESQVVENILQLKLSYFLHEDYGFYSYSEHYALGDIFVLCSHELDKGVLVELKGRGCRQFESYLLAQQRSWYEFFMDVLVAGGVMKRLDLAINDKTGILNIPVLTEKCQQEECISVFRSFKSYRSGELVRKEEKECMGNTLYIGSLQSEVYFCIYEKDYEQYKKNDIPIEDAEVKNRFEIRLKNERAYYAVRDLLVYDNPEHTAFKIINRYIRFVDKDDSKPRSDWKLNEEWAWFIGNNRERLKLTTKPEPYSFQRTLNWLSHQVAPTLKVAIKLDEINQTQVVKDILDHAKLTDRHKQILKQQSVKEQDVITTKK